MPSGASKFDRTDLRRQRRYLTPVFEVIVECEMFRSIDWSTGGIRLDGVCDGLPVGSAVEGWIALPGVSQALPFSGEIVRTDETTGNTVVCFDEIEAETASFLERSVACCLH